MRERAMSDLRDVSAVLRASSAVQFSCDSDIPLTTRQLSERRLPDTAEANLDFQTLGQILTLGRLQFRKVAREQLSEDEAKVAVDRQSPSTASRRLETKKSETYPLTFSQVFARASRLYRSSSAIVSSIIDLSLSTVAIIFLRACSFFSTLEGR